MDRLEDAVMKEDLITLSQHEYSNLDELAYYWRLAVLNDKFRVVDWLSKVLTPEIVSNYITPISSVEMFLHLRNMEYDVA